MSELSPRAGFDWKRVRWGAADAPRTDVCSYCGAAFPADSVPLMLFARDGRGAAFCRDCQHTWWGIESFDDVDDPHPDGPDDTWPDD